MVVNLVQHQFLKNNLGFPFGNMSNVSGVIDASSSSLGQKIDEKQNVRNILGVDVHDISRIKAFEFIEKSIEDNDHRKIAFLNAHGANIAYSTSEYREVLQKFDVLADGIGLDIGSDALYGQKFSDNLNGTDFLPELFEHIKRPLTIGLLGGKEGVAEKAARVLWERFGHHDFVIIHNGYFTDDKQEEILKCLEWVRPDILLVALGNPIQERWIEEFCTHKHAIISFGVGAFFDFVSGRIRRAPDWMLKLRIEWLYRLILEPKRMWRRYVVGNPLFIMRIYREKIMRNLRAKFSAE